MFHSGERERDFSFTQPHTVVHHAIFKTRQGRPVSGLDGLRGKELVVMEGDIMHDFVLAQGLTGPRRGGRVAGGGAAPARLGPT